MSSAAAPSNGVENDDVRVEDEVEELDTCFLAARRRFWLFFLRDSSSSY